MVKKIIVLTLIKCLVLTGVWLWHEGAGITTVSRAWPEPFEQASRDGTAIMHYRRNDRLWTYSMFVYRYDNMELIYMIENIDVVWYLESFFVSDDMMYLVHRGGDYIVFYAYGQVVTSVARWRFIEDYKAGESWGSIRIWDIHWEFVELNSETLQFTIETGEGRTVVFDMTNGNIIYGEVRTNNINSLALYGSIVASVCLVVGAVVVSNKKQRREKI